MHVIYPTQPRPVSLITRVLQEVREYLEAAAETLPYAALVFLFILALYPWLIS
jgi:hypothetical protein